MSTSVCQQTGKTGRIKTLQTPLIQQKTPARTTTWQLLGSMAVAGRSPKHLRAGSEDDCVDLAAIFDRAADRFSACMDTKVDSMMGRLEKRIDERIDSKLGPVMDRLPALEKTNSSSTRSGPSSMSDNVGSAGQKQRWRQWTCGIRPFLPRNQGVVWIPRQKHTWLDGSSGQGNCHQAATRNWS